MSDSGPKTATYAQGAHRELGLSDEEFAAIIERIGRLPSDLELAMYSVMWSEHCSYKSSRLHLAKLPSEGPNVLVGPGENAGVIDVGDGLAVALRIESHNHPSFVEPYQGAATGVGGILRDIFTMGARPIALMDGLFIGPLADAHSAYVLDGVVRGVAGYGNAVGVPTVGGQITFDDTYRTNPLVNVFCLGVLEKANLVLGAATGVGNLAVLLGARTGRDGIGGVSVLASAGFSAAGEHNADAAKRPSVQIGDPYEEKRLIEACLALLAEHLVVGIQDLGGAGLACATSETAARGGLGMDVDLDAVPRREAAMSPVEVMTSESQERMLAIVTPSALSRLQEICARWEVEASVIGTVVAPIEGVGRLRVFSGPERVLLADIPASSLADEAPKYDRAHGPPAGLAARRAAAPESPKTPDCNADLLALLLDASWIYRQYDHQLFLNTVFGPGEADASLLRLALPGIAPGQKALALSLDANPDWCALEPRTGTIWTVAESALNVSCAGARPIGLVNCLNFGNPEHEVVMWQLRQAIEGMAEACRGLSIPVVGGNVSLYNESAGADISPTPVVAVIGLLATLERRPAAISWSAGDSIVLLGPRSAEIAGSRWAGLHGRSSGTLETLDLDTHRRLCALVSDLVAESARLRPVAPLLSGVHDLSAGGLGLALAELAVSSGLGAVITAQLSASELFSEAPSRVVLASSSPEALLERCRRAGLFAEVIGTVGGDHLLVGRLLDLSVQAMQGAFSDKLPAALERRVLA